MKGEERPGKENWIPEQATASPQQREIVMERSGRQYEGLEILVSNEKTKEYLLL